MGWDVNFHLKAPILSWQIDSRMNLFNLAQSKYDVLSGKIRAMFPHEQPVYYILGLVMYFGYV